MENKIDKSKMLQSHIVLINEAVNFKGTVEGNQPISIDYTPPLGNNLGYMSLELFLLSLSSCMGTALLAILRKMRKEISHFEISSEGERKSDHPAGFKNITIMIHVKSEGLTDAEMVRAIQTMEGICPVLSMVNEKVDVQTMFQILT